jgi:hypothetical protein
MVGQCGGVPGVVQLPDHLGVGDALGGRGTGLSAVA